MWGKVSFSPNICIMYSQLIGYIDKFIKFVKVKSRKYPFESEGLVAYEKKCGG